MRRSGFQSFACFTSHTSVKVSAKKVKTSHASVKVLVRKVDTAQAGVKLLVKKVRTSHASVMVSVKTVSTYHASACHRDNLDPHALQQPCGRDAQAIDLITM